MNSDDIVSWLRAQLDVEERLALGATPGPWTTTENRCVEAASRRVIASVAARELWPTTADAAHIARHDPARALREVAAYREILDEYEEARDWYNKPEHRHHPAGEAHGLWKAVEALLPIFEGAPGYRPEWGTE